EGRHSFGIDPLVGLVRDLVAVVRQFVPPLADRLHVRPRQGQLSEEIRALDEVTCRPSEQLVETTPRTPPPSPHENQPIAAGELPPVARYHRGWSSWRRTLTSRPHS